MPECFLFVKYALYVFSKNNLGKISHFWYIKLTMYQKATVFEFTSYKFEPDKRRIIFNYKTEFNGKKPLFFTETIILPQIPNLTDIPKEVINKLLQSLHIILGISYYKFYCATNVKMPYILSKSEAEFWNTVYKKGLGEFFYKNKLDPKISPKFPFVKNIKNATYSLEKNSRCLVGIGGGKDSIVATELLKKQKFNITTFFVETNKKSELISNIIKTTGVKNLKIKRFLDYQVFLEHQYNGHIPISSIYAFLGILTAVLYRYSYFIIGNEYSSNFGNLIYKPPHQKFGSGGKGEIINHQWSKSYEFENIFQTYVRDFISSDVIYFSLLRSFYEIRIVKMFANYKKYFPYFSSCNSNFKIKKSSNGGLWCGKCPKCVFVFTLLSAFLTKKDLINIFNKNLYEDKNLLSIFKDVLGFGKIKPFDCVGTFEEAQTALYLAKKDFKNNFIVRQIGNRVKYHKEVFLTNSENSIPEQFKFLGIENVLIAGYGKEGKTSEKYLKKYYPNLKIGIADAKQSILRHGSGQENYLNKQKDFDIVIKTPGIKKELIKIPHTTATNIFFSQILGKNKIIGITGSKGKSTTSSLIFEILKKAGKNVIFLGNIGKPMLGALLNPTQKDEIFILELSSYQLDDLKFSPDIAVVTNLFPEHMDYHNGIKNYYQAKKNILNYQDKGAYFIYNPKNNEMTSWLKNYKGIAIPFAKNIPLEKKEIPLIGEHNIDNIKAAIAVAKILHISDQNIKNTIKNFKGLPHRLEFVGEFKGIKFYDDANAATPEATIMAIKSLPKIGTIFLGGTNRGYNFTQLEKIIKKYEISNIVLFPESGNRILKSKKGLKILKTKSMKEAVEFAYKNTPKGHICLLSCASPSYSLWKNFEEKGNEFKKIVEDLSK